MLFAAVDIQHRKFGTFRSKIYQIINTGKLKMFDHFLNPNPDNIRKSFDQFNGSADKINYLTFNGIIEIAKLLGFNQDIINNLINLLNKVISKFNEFYNITIQPIHKLSSIGISSNTRLRKSCKNADKVYKASTKKHIAVLENPTPYCYTS